TIHEHRLLQISLLASLVQTNSHIPRVVARVVPMCLNANLALTFRTSKAPTGRSLPSYFPAELPASPVLFSFTTATRIRLRYGTPILQRLHQRRGSSVSMRNASENIPKLIAFVLCQPSVRQV